MAEQQEPRKPDAIVNVTETTPAAPPTDTPERKTPEQRKSALAQMIANISAQGYRVESQQDFQAIIVKGKPINHPLHIIVSLLTLGFWLIGYAVIAATGGEKREMLQVDEWGNVSRQKL